ncbi:MAG TPA: MBL fold metallo-hydrolase [Longimicrobiaceae bacterium]|nr:MBL fold metallo-hydrolase [Longimicrobiaceae bacterium]
MPTLHLLGTGASLSTPDRTTTMLAVEGDSVLVIDCGGDVVQRLLAAGIDLLKIQLLILTHEHPDHVAGFPLFMQKLWLAGRRDAVRVRGPAPALDQARRLYESFDTRRWTGLPGIDWREVPLEENALVWEDDEWRVTASPGKHSVPVVGVRIDHAVGNGSVTYSADTERVESIARLARASDILVHEATGDFPSHTSAGDAAALARDAGVGRLLLVHLPIGWRDEDIVAAHAVFPDTEAGRDGSRYDF